MTQDVQILIGFSQELIKSTIEMVIFSKVFFYFTVIRKKIN